MDRPRQPVGDDQGPRGRRQRQPRAPPSAGTDRQRDLPVLAVGPEHDACRPTIATPATRRRSRSASSSRPTSSARSPACASTRRRRTPARTSAALWSASGAARWRRPRSPASRRPAGRPSRFSTPVAVQPEHDLRRVLLRAQRALLGQRRLLLQRTRARPERRRGRRQPAAARRPQHRHAPANGVYRYGAASAFPSNSFGARQLLGRRDLHADRRARHRDRRQRRPRAACTSANVTWSAPASGGAVTSYRITPYVGATAQTADDDHRLAAGRRPRRSPG